MAVRIVKKGAVKQIYNRKLFGGVTEQAFCYDKADTILITPEKLLEDLEIWKHCPDFDMEDCQDADCSKCDTFGVNFVAGFTAALKALGSVK